MRSTDNKTQIPDFLIIFSTEETSNRGNAELVFPTVAIARE